VTAAAAAANAAVVDRLTSAAPVVRGVRRAGDAIAGLDAGLVLHAGPPIQVGDLLAPMAAAIAGALVLEGRAPTIDAAHAQLRAGEVELASAHDHGAVGPVAGVITASMPVFEVVDDEHGVVAHATVNEGLGRVLRFGANDDAVLERLRWIAAVAAPALDAALASIGGIALHRLVAEALNRGDECHNRNKAATAQLVRQLAGAIVRTSPASAADVLDFVAGNDHFFLNLSMAAGKASTMAAGEEAGSSIVTAIASNGHEVGIRVAGTGGTWCTAPAPSADDGRWLDGFTADDAGPLMGDSFVTEVCGLGAFAAAAAPAIATYIGGSVGALNAAAAEMARITVAEHPRYRVPYLDFRGTPVGIDVHRVAATGIAPVVNAGFAARHAGVGQVGAGQLRLPIEPFLEAAATLGGARPGAMAAAASAP
jgi:hypothetical protein